MISRIAEAVTGEVSFRAASLAETQSVHRRRPIANRNLRGVWFNMQHASVPQGYTLRTQKRTHNPTNTAQPASRSELNPELSISLCPSILNLLLLLVRSIQTARRSSSYLLAAIVTPVAPIQWLLCSARIKPRQVSWCNTAKLASSRPRCATLLVLLASSY
jgi:hypothetical protein